MRVTFERFVTLSFVGAIVFVLLEPFFTPSGALPWEACRERTEKISCYERSLADVLTTKGMDRALQTLKGLSAVDPDVLRDDHMYAHHLGKLSLAYYGTAASAFGHCSDMSASGCYHGVLEAYLEQTRDLSPKDLADVCAKATGSQPSRYRMFQCLHGLGHGLSLHFGHDLFNALSFCDGLNSVWERESCYGGVFMENIVFFKTARHDEHASSTVTLVRHDPLYPCNALIRRYQNACYFLQSSGILILNDYNFQAAFRECEKAPLEFVRICYRSLGRDVSDYVRRNAAQAIELCNLGRASYVTYCLKGVVDDFIVSNGIPQHGFDLCRHLGARLKPDCYTEVGEFMVNFYPEQEQRVRACAQAEPAYVKACHVGAAVRPDQASPRMVLWRECLEQEDKIECYRHRLDAVLAERGTEEALASLERLAEEDPDVLRDSHQYVHQLGRNSYSHYKDVVQAFTHCRDTFASGCYHGVMEGYLRGLPRVEPQEIALFCNKIVEAQPTVFMKFQCVHGMGHGLTMYFDHDLFKALSACNVLLTAWDQESCYGGVFMENIMGYAAAAGHHHHRVFLKSDDPLYPCNAVKQKYRGACYLLQSSAILSFNNYDFAQGFRECDKAPAEFVPVCYQSMGRDINGLALNDGEKATELCRLGTPSRVRHCFQGVVWDVIYIHANPDEGLVFCESLDRRFKKDCYASIGEYLIFLYKEKPKRTEICKRAEKGFVSVCEGATQAI
jgi:hypothetical protein